MWEPPSWPPPWLTGHREKERAESGLSSHAGNCQLRTAWLCSWGDLSSHQAEEDQVLRRDREEQRRVAGHPCPKPQANWKHTPALREKTPHPKLNPEESRSQPPPGPPVSLSSPHTRQMFSTLVFQKMVPTIRCFSMVSLTYLELETRMPVDG